MAKRYYHNLTTKVFNEACEVDLIDNYTEGDELYFTDSGCAIMYKVEPEELEEMKKQTKKYHKYFDKKNKK